MRGRALSYYFKLRRKGYPVRYAGLAVIERFGTMIDKIYRAKRWPADSTTLSDAFGALLRRGFIIQPTSCTCGGHFAWIGPDFRMVGCICHNDPKVIIREWDNKIKNS